MNSSFECMADEENPVWNEIEVQVKSVLNSLLETDVLNQMKDRQDKSEDEVNYILFAPFNSIVTKISSRCLIALFSS